MSEAGAPVTGPDFRQGVTLAELADGAMLQVTWTTRRRCCYGKATRCSRSARAARIMAGRWPKASWLATHAERWDRVDVDGDPAAHDCTATFWREGRKLATASVGRDLDSLRAEVAFEQELAQ